MSDDFVTEKVFYETLEKMEEKAIRNFKWLITTVIAIGGIYASVMFAQTLSKEEQQSALDQAQTQQNLETARTIQETAALLRSHAQASGREMDATRKDIDDVEARATARIERLENEQREHERNERNERNER